MSTDVSEIGTDGTRLLLTGAPGVGKTTVVRAVAAALASRRPGGFFTEEIRAGRVRQGFALVTFDGRRALMAHVDRAAGPRVGKYGVDVGVIEEVARSALAVRAGIDVYLVDEIGKMECLSPSFVAATRTLLDEARVPVVATIGERGGGFMDEVKRRPDVVLWEITPKNRDAVPARVLAWIEHPAASPPPGRPRRTHASPRRG
jgi:nucleoside-triphosphatase